MTAILLLLFLLSACAAFVQRVSGFGFGIFIMMFLPYIMPSYNVAVALSGILSGTTALFIVIRNIRHVRWDKMFLVVLSNALVSYVAIMYMRSVDGLFMRRMLGVLLVAVAIYFLFFESRMHLSFRSRWSRGAVGSVSGVMGSMFGMPGPPVVLYGVSEIEDKKEYMATMQAFWLVFNIIYLFFRSGGGYYTSDTPLFWGVGVAGILIGVYLGALCFNALSREGFKKVVYTVMLASGMVALFK